MIKINHSEEEEGHNPCRLLLINSLAVIFIFPRCVFLFTHEKDLTYVACLRRRTPTQVSGRHLFPSASKNGAKGCGKKGKKGKLLFVFFFGGVVVGEGGLVVGAGGREQAVTGCFATLYEKRNFYYFAFSQGSSCFVSS